MSFYKSSCNNSKSKLSVRGFHVDSKQNTELPLKFPTPSLRKFHSGLIAREKSSRSLRSSGLLKHHWTGANSSPFSTFKSLTPIKKSLSKIKDYFRGQFIYKPSFTSHHSNRGNAFWKKNSITYFSILDSSFHKLMWIESNSWTRVLSSYLSTSILDRMVSCQKQWVLTLVCGSSPSIRSHISFNLNYLGIQYHCHFCYVHSFNNFIL